MIRLGSHKPGMMGHLCHPSTGTGRQGRTRSLSKVSLAVAIAYSLAGTKDKNRLGKQGCVLAFAPELVDFSGRKDLEKETWVELRSLDTTNTGQVTSPEACFDSLRAS